MRIIFAESGQEIETKNVLVSSDELSSLKREIEKIGNIKPSDQILLTTHGAQIKEDNVHKLPSLTEDYVILFNRRLLQNPSRLFTTYNIAPDLIGSNSIPSLQEIEESFIDALESNSDEEVENIGIMNQLKSIIQTIIDSSYNRKVLIEKLTKEISLQSIALNSALSNLETHVRTAYQNIGKFDRIAQREFGKHEQAITRIHIDLELLKQIQIHPRILTHITHNAPSLKDHTLDQFVPLQQLESIQAETIQQYNYLVSATLEQKNKITWLNQQTANVSVNRTTSDMATDRVTKLKNECHRYTDALSGLQKKIMGDFNRRRMAYGIDASHATIRKYKKDLLQDAFRSLYLHMASIYDAEKSVLEERKTFLSAFIKCMQSISQVEESITQIYPRLADLEKGIKVLRGTLDKGKGTIAKRIVKGYGILLIELWRRDKYSEIATKNASLLTSLFEQFGKREEKYRKSFIENEIICVDDESILLSDESGDELAVVPFQIQGLSDSPIVCQAFTSTSTTGNYVITKEQVEDFIQLVQSFYETQTQPNSSNRSTHDRDLPVLLQQKLERESKRLNKGLIKLGLPTQQQQRNSSVSLSSAAKESLSSPLISRSVSTPTSTSVSQYYTPDMKAMSPSSVYQPYKEWESEKASILRQSQDMKRYAEEIEFKREQDKIKFEQDKQILLHELKSKDKLIQEVHEKHQLEIQDFQQQLQKLQMSHREREQDLQDRYENTLKLEQEKFERRFLGFHQRMHAKDKAYASLEAAFSRETKSAPTSPPTSPIKSSFSSSDSKQEEAPLQQLEIQHHRQNNKQAALQIKALQEENKALDAEVRQSKKHHSAKEQEYVSHIQTLETDLRDIRDKYAHHVAQMHEQLTSSESRWKSLFMAENQETVMRAEARVDNLVAEHQHTLRDLQDAHQRELHIVDIKHQTELDKKERHVKEMKAESMKLKKEKSALTQQWSKLQRAQTSAVQIAKELLSVTGSSGAVQNTNLADLLKIAIGNVTNLQHHSSVLENNLSAESHYMAGLPPYFGY